ncbi:hypothetical protein G5V59_15850 [Nocardioides sp. W3-2-3]|uniref:hypothetical protein n=1 Tax=Nocardioides convexus TaxID=2712224 RepID=UPI0024188767|nr:hypothetical protein [Nocardioides convexus]NHA00897.1 hypothetical protein [Nocardioides convexus]
MTEWDALDDDESMALLGQAVADGEAVPEHRREAARAAFTWRSVAEEPRRVCCTTPRWTRVPRCVPRARARARWRSAAAG